MLVSAVFHGNHIAPNTHLHTEVRLTDTGASLTHTIGTLSSNNHVAGSDYATGWTICGSMPSKGRS